MIIINSRFLTQKITGAQRFAIELSRRLKRLNPKITFLAPKNIIHQDLAKELNVKVIGVNTGHLWEQLDLPLYLKRKGSPLLVNLANTAPLLYKNKIVTILDISWKHFPDSVSKKFYLYYSFLVPKIAKNSLKVLTISNFCREDIFRNLKLDKNKISVIYCAVDGRFKPLNLRRDDIVLSVATLQPYKNMESLIRAFILLKKNNSELKKYKLVLVGGMNQKVFRQSSIKSLIAGRKDIILTGYVSDGELVEWYNKAQVFVLPSKFEGFGIPPIEAMACGTPVIVSNIASLPEVCGDAAYYVNPYDVNDIARGIYTVLKNENLQKELTQKGLERVKIFSWEESAKRLLKVIEEVEK